MLSEALRRRQIQYPAFLDFVLLSSRIQKGLQMEEKKKESADWELSEDFYKEEITKTLSLDDFVEDEECETADTYSVRGELERVVADVKAVQKLQTEGKNTEEIAAATGLDVQYVYNIQICTQGFHEDDAIAVAHLVMMG